MENTQSHQINTITNDKIPQDSIPNESKLIGEVYLLVLINQTGLGYVRRDNGVKTEEEQGLIEFKIVKNDK